MIRGPAQRLALAGFLLAASWILVAQEPESRPESRPLSVEEQSRRNKEERLKAVEEIVEAAAAKDSARRFAEALELYDRAEAKLSAWFDRSGMPFQPSIDLYKEIVQRSDRLVEKVEAPEFEAKVLTRDMLLEKERTLWASSVGAKYSAAVGAIAVEGVRTDRKITGVVSLLPKKDEAWHDVVIDLEFTIDSGELGLELRYWPDKRYYSIKLAPATGYEVNKPHRITIRIKGSTITLAQPGETLKSDTMDISTSRTGGIGFGLNPGSKVTISKLDVKVLR